MKYTDLSPLAQSLWQTLNELEPALRMTISEMAYESYNDPNIPYKRRLAYEEVYNYASQPAYEQQ